MRSNARGALTRFPERSPIKPNALGALGERLAEGWLRERGFRIVDRPNKYAHYDFLVERKGAREYVEVKTKRVTGTGEDRRHDIRPEGWAFWERAEHPVRFLLVFVDLDRGAWWLEERQLPEFRRTGVAKWKLVAPPPRPPRTRRRLPDPSTFA